MTDTPRTVIRDAYRHTLVDTQASPTVELVAAVIEARRPEFIDSITTGQIDDYIKENG